MVFDSLKNKFEYYRSLTDYKLTPNSYVMIMLDGRSFSKKVKKKFKRPFDNDFINMMNNTALYLCDNINGCKIAYVQSDEITLILHDEPTQEPFFGNRICKLQSVIASMATSKFNQLALYNSIKDLNCSKDDVVGMVKNSSLYEFDCKAWVVPNINEAFASILYRQNDCVRNSKEAVAQYYFSSKELHKKVTDTQIEMVKKTHGVDWFNDFNDGEKYGRFIKRFKLELPEVDKNGNETGKLYERHKWAVCNAYPLSDENNRIEFIKYINNGECTN